MRVDPIHIKPQRVFTFSPALLCSWSVVSQVYDVLPAAERTISCLSLSLLIVTPFLLSKMPKRLATRVLPALSSVVNNIAYTPAAKWNVTHRNNKHKYNFTWQRILIHLCTIITMLLTLFCVVLRGRLRCACYVYSIFAVTISWSNAYVSSAITEPLLCCCYAMSSTHNHVLQQCDYYILYIKCIMCCYLCLMIIIYTYKNTRNTNNNNKYIIKLMTVEITRTSKY